MARLDTERQQRLEPKRMQSAIDIITSFGYKITFQSGTEIRFIHQGSEVKFFPYSGWHTGKSIKDGRGLQNLTDQLDPLTKQ